MIATIPILLQFGIPASGLGLEARQEQHQGGRKTPCDQLTVGRRGWARVKGSCMAHISQLSRKIAE